uniref:BRO1 domain-containing protein n=1 Tax=Panagrolaimus superbus TaxID=310955 RepID=A0A914XZ19_9BILA
MEGIPKVPMISPDMKIPDDPMPADWIPKLREYIFTHYNDDPSKFNEAFKELSVLRYHACRYSADTESICIMKRYYAQLQMMKSRFPMETNEPVSVSFAWSDRSCDMAVGAAYEDINYEICCIMYNIGAAHATIGMNETRSDEDSRKNAFSNFQCASWPFECLRDKLNASKFASSNFEPELLTFFSQILLVQAQECLIEKAIFDNRTNVIVSKLARYAAETYFELKIRLDQDTLSDYILNSKLKTWKRLCEAKAHFYEAIKRYYLGQQCCEDEKHGESVAHLAAALEQIKEAQKVVQKDKRESESMKQAISFALDIISQKEAKVRKENDFVYHDRVPKAEDLTQVEPVTKAKAMPFDPFKRDTCGDDLFAALLPANVLKGVSLYSEEKAKLKRGIIQSIEKKDTDLEQHLLSLQLSQLNLDQNLDEMRLPEELLQASAAFTAQPHALFDLLDQLNVVATKSSEAEIKLTDLRHRLLNVKCPQLEEDQGFKVISTKVNELMDHHIQARANNTELQKALASQSEQLKLLALPLTELAKNICDKVVNVSETPEGKRLREMVEKVEEMRKGRIQLFENFKDDLENDDITSKILAEKDFSMDSLFEKELKKHDKAVQIIEMNLNAQDKILNALTEANANFAECRRDIVENNEKRRSQCVSLITAYQVFSGVKEKTEAATTFYNQLFALINALDKSVTGMEDSFKGERERHEEQKRIIAEKTKLYRERTAMESSNEQQPSPTTAERRRPKLGDYMAFYRNKMAGSQPQTILNASDFKCSKY